MDKLITADYVNSLIARVAELESELAGKNKVIKLLNDDIRHYRKDWKDSMIQDQGLPVD